ncbi:PREDICTED: serine palmitoyltransferase 1 [Nicrophorus vespilloides]|uniref:Serine palmitoyltransferase 1 n=1 Tax=Nicrophorus vespilloides TaxID=110193 RepID=A0ABM1MBG3_NICVS|nr:PREDICTED: serine palmitoyltransferase 1 [Nicrophorus vespilloides]
MSFTAENIPCIQCIVIPLIILLISIFALFVNRSNKRQPRITIDELNRKLCEFVPEPLAPENELYVEPIILEQSNPTYVFNNVQNLLSNNYLNLTNKESIKKIATDCIRSNGVGSCGPRGFYGTVDVHLDLECRISEFMGLEETVLYSYSVSTLSSAIIAYCKRGDVIFCDEKLCNPSIEGIKASKATIVYFNHNDMADLENKLIEHDEREKNKKNKSRKFLIVEGIYFQTGKICPLPELMAIREKYMLRMFLDESISFGAIGTNGRGVTEYYNVNRKEIDLIVGSLEFGVSSIGGFCVGSSFVIEHQRLSGLGYCFSASLPPFLSSIAIHAIDLFDTKPELFEKLHNVCKLMHNELSGATGITILSDPLSPKKVFSVAKVSPDSIIDYCKERGVIVDKMDENIYFNINIEMDKEYISKVVKVITSAV